MKMADTSRPFKRLTRTERDLIERYLNLGMGLTKIAAETGFSVSSIMREIKTHRIDLGYRRSTASGISNLCAHRRECEKTSICIICQRKGHPRCASCKKVRCSNLCKDFIRLVCPTTEASPYVCNGCAKTQGCVLHKWRYSALEAQAASDAQRVVSRVGIDTDPAAINAVNKIIRPLLKRGQSPGQIWLTHSDEIPFSRRTLYRYNSLGLFGMTAFELPRKVRYRQRRKKLTNSCPFEIPRGHFYKDFCALDEETKEAVVQLDTVMGSKTDEKSILTLHAKRIHFQIGILLSHHDCAHVVAALDWLESISAGKFEAVFGIGLTDRGTEFSDTSALEASAVCKASKRMFLYYCDARRSDQKGAAEKNHVELRKIVPKGTSIDGLSAWDLATVFSHVNSTPRRSLFGASPMQLAQEILPKDFFDELGLSLIPADKVILSPSLLK